MKRRPLEYCVDCPKSAASNDAMSKKTKAAKRDAIAAAIDAVRDFDQIEGAVPIAKVGAMVQRQLLAAIAAELANPQPGQHEINLGIRPLPKAVRLKYLAEAFALATGKKTDPVGRS